VLWLSFFQLLANVCVVGEKGFIFKKYNGRYLGRSGVRMVIPTRPCSHVRRTPQPAKESVDQRRRSRFTIIGFPVHDDNRKKTSRTRISYGSNSRHTHEVVLGDGDTIVPCRNHKNTRTVAREKRQDGRSQRKFWRKRVPE
jgi:hypothetical protein